MEAGRKVKSRSALIFWLIAMVLATGWMAGCAPAESAGKETDERSYRRGKSLLREGRRDEALQAFLAVVGKRPDAAESHLEVGLIYLNHIKDPLAAIYHFRAHLAQQPNGEHAEFVHELILTAQKDFAQSLPGEPFGDAVERVNLMETVKALRDEVNQLKQANLQLQRDLTTQQSEAARTREALAQRPARERSSTELAPIVITPTQAADTTSTPARSYTVQGGDTLSRISTNMYGNPNRWKDIFEANRDQLPSPNALKPGQVLRIP